MRYVFLVALFWAMASHAQTKFSPDQIPDLDDLNGAVTDSQVPNDITITQNAGTDITADLEEEAHASEHSEDAADEILAENLGTECTNGQVIKSDGSGGLDCGSDNTGSLADGDYGDISVGSSGTTMTIDAGVVSADELNEAGVESGLEAVLDLEDLQGAVTDSQVPDDITITVSESDVTQHEGALTITESQISNLGTYETADSAITKADEAETITGDWDFGGGTLQIPNGTSLPGTCEVGDQFMDTDATSGQRHYLCESTNTWAVQGDGGASGGDEWGDAVDADIVPDGDGTRDLGSTSNRFAVVSVDSIDLNGTSITALENNADATDTANVTAAGALMDSEVDADIQTLALPASTTISSYGASLVDDANAGAARTTLGVDAAGTDNSTNVTLAGSLDYITLSGQEITRNAIDLTADVTGDLPVAEGGTGASTAAGARTNLDVDQAGTDNSTNVTLAGTPDYITISGQEITRGTVDIGDDTNLSAGRSLTLTGDSVAADAELYTDLKEIVIPDPATTDSGDAQLMFPTAVTITRVACSTDTGTATIQFDERGATTPNTGGTDVMSSQLVCDSDQQATTSFSNSGIASRVPMNLDIDAVASDPTVVRIFVEYTVND